MLLEPLPNDLRLADVSVGGIGLRVVANKDINSGFFELLASQKLVKLSTGSGDSLSSPIGDLSRAKTFCVSEWKEEFDRCRCHALAVNLTMISLIRIRLAFNLEEFCTWYYGSSNAI